MFLIKLMAEKPQGILDLYRGGKAYEFQIGRDAEFFTHCT